MTNATGFCARITASAVGIATEVGALTVWMLQVGHPVETLSATMDTAGIARTKGTPTIAYGAMNADANIVPNAGLIRKPGTIRIATTAE